ncbi:hypothetical protein KY290_017470 [Solanum tuberosum]|uniref:Endonuclease/exonuclease/phosphatase domain-containing protein n=1 Tax=Solanum tuberosum TaxID=4113 RepID=A0ABQ7VBI1_SOLTU|nr:hypothetical protein KY290_017470 [Solanum tuberosum]
MKFTHRTSVPEAKKEKQEQEVVLSLQSSGFSLLSRHSSSATTTVVVANGDPPFRKVTRPAVRSKVDGLYIYKVSAVYATKCSALERLELWEDLEMIAINTQEPWIVGGDFNVILKRKKSWVAFLSHNRKPLILLSV